MVADHDAPGTYPIRSVDRVCDILDTLANSANGVTLTEVADATDLPKSSAFRYLSALEVRSYIERDPDTATYRLGPAFRPQHTRGIERLAELALPALAHLRDRFGETTNLGVLDGTMVVHTLVCESPQMMRLAARVGDRGYVHSTALGKAMCAQLPPDRVRAILAASDLTSFTPSTIVDPVAFAAELSQVRGQGYAVDDMENQGDGRCVAVAIEGLAFHAGLSVSAPASRLSREQVAGTAKVLRRTAATLAKQMGSS